MEPLVDGPTDVAHEDELKRSLVRVWDTDAAGYDALPGHGLRDVRVEEVWRAAIAGVLGDAREGGAPRLRVLDVGTGTGGRCAACRGARSCRHGHRPIAGHARACHHARA
jgi:hypothetical protein